MSIQSANPGRRRRSLLEALFGEAWELERRRRRRYLVSAVVVVLGVAVVLMLRSGGRSSPAAVTPAKPVELYAAGTLDVGAAPQALLASAGSLWIATPRSLVRLNLRNGATIARTPIAASDIDAGLAFGAGSIWLARTGTSRLLRIDPASNRVIARIGLGVRGDGHLKTLGGGVAVADGRIWVSRVSNGPRGDVVAVDPETDRVSGAPITVGAGPDAITAGFGALWVDNTSVDPRLSRIDPRTRRVRSEPLSGTPVSGFGSLWVLPTSPGSSDTAITRVDPANGRTLAQIEVPRAVALAFGDGRAWALSYPRSRSASRFLPIKGTALLSQIDPRTNHVIGRPIHLSLTEPVAMVVSHRQLWIADFQGGKVVHFQLTK